MGVTKQIIGSFEDIGKGVVSEAIKVPVDIAGKAMESLGASSTPQQSGAGPQAQSEAPRPKDAWDTFDTAGANAKAFARRALEAFRKRPVKKEPSVWERMNEETEKKKEFTLSQQQQAAASQLPKMSAKRPPGDLYGVKAKTLGGEIGKNVNTG